jgi:dTDP-4-dehydrorhamnose 3,5-epimerase
MKKTKIDEIYGAFIVESDRHHDSRGWFQELYSTARDYPHLIGIERQLNMSHSRKGVVRGLHVAPFAKLCSCLSGRVYDVIADVRPDSPTYLNWFGVWLENNSKQVFVPANCAHGFFSSEDNTLFMYLQDGTYNPNVEKQVNWRDPKIGIVWPPCQEYIISDKDKHSEFIC